MELVRLVKDNLVRAQMWTQVEVGEKALFWRSIELRLIQGLPPEKLPGDETRCVQNVLAVDMSQYRERYLTGECLQAVFRDLCPAETQRIILALAGDDGTVVFYFVHKGIQSGGGAS